MNDEFEILVTPHRRWKRLALLLQSETKDNCLKRSTQYNTFYYDNCFYYDDSDDLKYLLFDDDMEQLRENVQWVKARVISLWKHFIDTM